MTLPPLTASDFVRGERDAPLLLVHYGDFECPYSGALYPTLRELESRFGSQIAVVFRQFPLSDVHPHAFPAALAAQAAGEKFWAMHDTLFENQDELREADLLDYARQIGLDVARFRADFHLPATRQAVETSFQNAQNIGLHGTPSVFINGEFHDNREGMWKMARILPLVEQALAASGTDR